jgi:murein DD-endopeptidase MepM/ murein hydrolase activator NlpD
VTFDIRNRRLVMAAAALVVALPVAAYLAGALFGAPHTPEIIPESAAATPPIPPVPVATAPERPQPIMHTVEIASGDNLMDVLVKAGAERFEAHGAIRSLDGVYNPRRDLRVGDELQITLGPADAAPDPETEGATGDAGYVLSGLRLPVSYDREVEVARESDGGFIAREVVLPLETELVRVSGTIDSSLYVNGLDAGIPISVLVELIRIYSFDVDFQRDIWQGDAFEIMFERQRNEAGEVVNNGDIHYAKLTLRNTDLPLYRYETAAGNIDYFNRLGESVRKALMKTPLDGARLSSRFGKRKHPILGYTRLHAGVDFAAPTGTPVYAAGDGSVERASVHGGYGKYIRIRHNGTYSTAYAHLNGYARGIRQGVRVRQGQVIGYVGSTGRSTGPHLHYEILRDGKQINPLGLKLPSGEKLKGDALAQFTTHRDGVDQRFASLEPPTMVADTAEPEPPVTD